MSKVTLFQTLEDRGNPNIIERDGPFFCNWPNTWLGSGYYFWEAFIQNAHWWGKLRYTDKNKGYIICQAECEFTLDKCFDLVGSTEHLSKFADCYNLMKEKGLANKKTTVARILTFMRETLKIFNYEAIRAYGINSISKNNPEFTYRLSFERDRGQYLDYSPAYQICIFNKNGLNLTNYKIVFPDEYNNDYVV